MLYKFEDCITRFRTNNPYAFKKAIILLLLISYFGYLIYSRGFWELIFFAFSLPTTVIIVCIRSKITNPFKALKTSISSLFNKYRLDVLPIEFDVNDKTLTVNIDKAEYFNKHIYSESFIIDKNHVTNILYYKYDNLLKINFDIAKITLNGAKKTKTAEQSRSSVCIYFPETSIKESEALVAKLNECKYKVLDIEKMAEQKREEARKAEELPSEESKGDFDSEAHDSDKLDSSEESSNEV